MTWLTGNGYLLMMVTAIAWSGNAIVARGAHELIPPVGLAFWRWSATLPILLLLAWPHLKRDIPEALRNWRIMLFLSVLSVSIYNSLIYIALNSTTATNSFLINTSRPAIIVLMSLMFFRIPFTPVQAFGLAFGLLGTVIIVLRGDLAVLATLDFNPGDIWVVVATICWALYTVFLHKRPKVHPASFMVMTVFFGLPILFPFYLWESLTLRTVPIVPETFGAVAYLAVAATVIAYLSYNRAVELLGANRAGLTSYLLPVFGVTLAILLLDEQLQIFHLVGITLLLGGTWLATRGKT